jgi:hypothetical protein
MTRKASQSVGAEHATRLQKWIADTPLSLVPRNHSGHSAKSAICKVLGISPSTIGTNARLKELFELLDLELSETSTKQIQVVVKSDAEAPTASELLLLLDELDATRAELARLRHLSNTGQWISA